MVKPKNVGFKFPTKHIKGVSVYKPSVFMLWFIKFEVTVTVFSNVRNQDKNNMRFLNNLFKF